MRSGRDFIDALIDRIDLNGVIGRTLPPSWKAASRLRRTVARLRRANPPLDVTGLLDSLLKIAAAEKIGKSIGIRQARLIGRILKAGEEPSRFSEPLQAALDAYPDSIYLIYCRAVLLAKDNDFAKANELITAAMKRALLTKPNSSSSEWANPRRHSQLTKIWQVVDSISRDAMAWTPDEADEQETVSELRDTPLYAERSLQQRRSDAYLNACLQSFNQAESVQAKLAVVAKMTRQGLRRTPTYHEAYEVARKSYRETRLSWWRMVGVPLNVAELGLDKDQGKESIHVLMSATRSAKKLGFTQDFHDLSETLFALLGEEQTFQFAWTIAATLVFLDTDAWHARTAAVLKGAATPRSRREIKALFDWAHRCGEYDYAEQVYQSLPRALKKSAIASSYTNVLARMGRRRAAAQLTTEIAARHLTTPDSVRPDLHWAAINRIGELQFAAETSAFLKLVPQPEKLAGLLFVAPRTIAHATRLPLAVLLEMKRRGWAIVPLVEGVLPQEKTGIESVDRFLGCIQITGRIKPDVQNTLKRLEGFTLDPAHQTLRWNDIDLAHILWEEAAINRRRYNVDFSCPSLVEYLKRLGNWTRTTATILENARQTASDLGIPAAFMVNFQSRLPEAIVRFYCEKVAEPDRFFCVHATNGYQNYFANFTTPVSTRLAVRNITATAVNRTASFPTPGEFNEFFDAHRDEAPAILERVKNIPKMRRSTGAQLERPVEATACIERISAWRAKGGKVACIFGKVVCDSALPYDGGPCHTSMKDWLLHSIEAVQGSNTLLLIKPHPHENKNQVGAFLTEKFEDLAPSPLPENVVILGNNWFDMADMKSMIDLGLVYNGTTAVELGLMEIPTILSSYFAPIDYPIGQTVPKDRAQYARMLRFEETVGNAADIPQRAALWLHYVSGNFSIRDYRYHARPITNIKIHPPYWFKEDMERFLLSGDPHVAFFADQIGPTSAAKPS